MTKSSRDAWKLYKMGARRLAAKMLESKSEKEEASMDQEVVEASDHRQDEQASRGKADPVEAQK